MRIVSKKLFLFFPFLFATPLFFSSCMTSERQDTLQTSIDNLQSHVNKLEGQLSSKDAQINNTTQTAIASQTEAQSLRDQLQLTQGAVDELKNKLKKIEENSGITTNLQSQLGGMMTNTENIYILEKKIALLELKTNLNYSSVRKGKLPSKIKNINDEDKILKSTLDKGDFKAVAAIASTILSATDATNLMMATALEYRGEAKFQMKDFRGSAADLATELEYFPNPPRKARALLLTGDSYVYLKNNLIAQYYYQDCVKYFASESEGKAASARLSSLNATTSTPSSHKSK